MNESLPKTANFSKEKKKRKQSYSNKNENTLSTTIAQEKQKAVSSTGI